ncbi:MAG: class I SAM-dependent methyltransferase [Firmicutes bacterium]|nr:class I SAM-dependent methyltransferase [Bacillota bacterium]
MNHNVIYNKPLYYEILFSYRDFSAEVDFLTAVFGKHAGRELKSVVELACGPGDHALEFAQRGIRAVGIDISGEMVEYAAQRADEAGSSAVFIRGDMLDFSLDKPVDSALLMISSIGYILNGDDFVRHLKAVAKNLTEGGIYFIEAPHPSSIIGNEPRTQNNWVMNRDGVEVEMTWGFPEDYTDPITQITDTSVLVKVCDNGENFEFSDKAPQREYTYQEIKALVRLSGVFEIAEVYGGFDMAQPFDNSPKSWRMNLVLRKMRS